MAHGVVFAIRGILSLAKIPHMLYFYVGFLDFLKNRVVFGAHAIRGIRGIFWNIYQIRGIFWTLRMKLHWLSVTVKYSTNYVDIKVISNKLV